MADPQRRKGDRGWRRLLRENWYRDVWLVVVSIVVLVAVIEAVHSSNQANRAAKRANEAVQRVQEGRRVAVGVTCAALSAVSQAGHDLIVRSARPVNAAQERAFELLGFPPYRQRRVAAEMQARAYVRSISEAVDHQIGSRGDQLVRADGTLDCVRLGRLSAIHK